MQLRKLTYSNYSKGFTVIELLIVIIVIAILATLAIVSYQGIQQKTANTKTLYAARQWAEALHAYKAENDKYPVITGVCLGDNSYPVGYNDSNTGKCYSGGGYAYRSSMASAMQPYFGNNSVPTPDFQAVGTSGGTWFRGLLYDPLDYGNEATLGYVVGGTSTCPSVAGTEYASQETVTGGVYCRATLN